MAKNDEILLTIRPKLEGADLDAVVKLVRQKLEAMGKSMPAFSDQAYRNVFKGISDAAALTAMSTNKSLLSIDVSSVKGKADELVGYWNRSMKALLPPAIPLGGVGGMPQSTFAGLFSALRSQATMTVTGGIAGVGIGALMPPIGGLPTALTAATAAMGGATSAAKSTLAGILELAAGFGIATTAIEAARWAFGKIKDTFVEGLKTVDQLRMSAASMAGAMLISDPSMNFKQALANANALIEKTYIMTRMFVGSAHELQLLTEAAVTFGMKLDFTTQKGQEQFIAFANTLKLVTQGQNFEIQAFQEIRAIMQGQNFQGAMLARRLQAVGVNVQEMVPLWVKQGTVIEEITNRLAGYGKATKTIQDTLGAQLKTLGSIASLTLAMGFGWTPASEKQTGAYADIRDLVKSINDYLLGANGFTDKQRELVEKVKTAWEAVKLVVTSLWYALDFAVLTPLSETIKKLQEIKQLVVDIKGWVDKWGFGSKVPKTEEYWTPARLEAGKRAPEGSREKAQYQTYMQWEAGQEKPRKGIGLEEWTTEATDIMGVAKAPSALQIPVSAETIEFIKKVDEFLVKQNERLAETMASRRSELGGIILREQNRIRDEFAAYFRFDPTTGAYKETEEFTRAIATRKAAAEDAIIKRDRYRATTADYGDVFAEKDAALQRAVVESSAALDRIGKLRGLIWPRMAEVEGKAIEKWQEKAKEAIEKLRVGMAVRDDAIKEMFERGAEGWRHARAKYAVAGSEIGKTIEEIDSRINKEIEAAEKTLKAKSLRKGDYADVLPQIEVVTKDLEERKRFEKLQAIIAYNEKLNELDKLRQATVQRTMDDLRELQKVADVGVVWPWNEEQITRSKALAEEEKRHVDLLQKINAEADKYNKALALKPGELPTVGMSPEETAKAVEAVVDIHRRTNEKIIEVNDFTTKQLAKLWNNLWASTTDMFSTLFTDALTGKLKSFKDYFQSFVNSITQIWARGMAEMLVKSIQMQMGEGFLGGFGGILNWIAGMLGLATGAPSGQTTQWSAGGDQPATFQGGGGYALAQGGILPGPWTPIKAFASGGLVDRPTLGWVGEGSGPEAVIPLSGGKVPVDIRGGGKKQDVNVNFNIVTADTKDFDRLIMGRRSLIAGIIRSELSNAGYMRDSVRRYA